ncbi:MAG: hypothetical protein HY822_16925 [Acidobacteria bacterium]|nr:hypothetical protein [Acidobacteriota bacterium]
MQLCDIFLGLGDESFAALLRGVSMGKLRTYQLVDRMKARAHMAKLNSESLRKAAPRLWVRLEAREEDVAQDVAQAILVSQLGLIVAVLNFLGVPHDDGFFQKDIDASQYLTDGWQQRAWDHFSAEFPRPALLFYINHLAWELAKAETVFTPAA